MIRPLLCYQSVILCKGLSGNYLPHCFLSPSVDHNINELTLSKGVLFEYLIFCFCFITTTVKKYKLNYKGLRIFYEMFLFQKSMFK